MPNRQPDLQHLIPIGSLSDIIIPFLERLCACRRARRVRGDPGKLQIQSHEAAGRKAVEDPGEMVDE